MNHEVENYTTDFTLSLSSDDEKPSALYALLPKLVRSRLRRLPSIRRPVPQHSRSYSASPSDSRRSSTEVRTPPPGYTSRISLSEPVSDSEELDDQLIQRRPSSSSSAAKVGSGSGIRWNFAHQGSSLRNCSPVGY